MTRAKDISKIVTDADLSGTLDVTGDLSVDNATLKVDSTNNRVGISTSSMTSKFEVAVSDNTAIQEAITIKGTQSGAYGGYLGWKDNWSGDSYTGYRGAIIADVPSANSGRLRFFTANSSTLSEKMRIDSTGRVMIGNTTEGVAGADELTVGNTSAGNGITIRSASNSSGALFFSDGTSGSAEYDGGFEYNHSSQFMRISTAGSEQMRISSNGHVSVGTTDNTYGFNVGGSGSDVRGKFQGSNQYRLGLQNGTNDIVWLGSGGANNFRISNSSGSTRFEIDSSGAVTIPNQPAFLANLGGSSQSNIAVGSDITVEFDNEIFDQNADYNTSTYKFTAPVTGKYQFNIVYYLENIDTATGYYYIFFDTSNRNYFNIMSPAFTADTDYLSLTLSQLADMDAGDVAYCRIRQSHGTSQTDINANSYFSGYLVA